MLGYKQLVIKTGGMLLSLDLGSHVKCFQDWRIETQAFEILNVLVFGYGLSLGLLLFTSNS